MWTLKLETSHEGTLIANLARKHSVSFSGYPIKHHKTKSSIIVQVCGFIDGPQENFNSLVKEGKRDKIIERVYINRDFVIASLRLPSWVSVLYSPEIIFISPQKYTSDGKETMELASWNKKPLMDLVRTFKQRYNTRVLAFSQKKIKSISLVSLHPELTDRQRLALELAVKNGYYEFPKSITLKQLAKLMGVSFSTYQAHLSKAELHFIPEMLKRFS